MGSIFNQKRIVHLTSNYREMATNTTKRDILSRNTCMLFSTKTKKSQIDIIKKKKYKIRKQTKIKITENIRFKANSKY